MRQLALISLVLISCGRTSTQPAVPEPSLIRFPTGQFTPQEASDLGMNIDHHKSGEWTVAYLEGEKLAGLSDQQRSTIVEMDSKAWASGHYQSDFTLKPTRGRPTPMEGYHDYRALTAELERLRDEYPDLVRMETAGQSVQGRELWYVVLSDNAAVDEPEPKFIYHANMHGDEVVGRELMIYLLRHMLQSYGSDQRITHLINHSQLFIMPSMNPDGFELRRRSNARGYDLNRNFPDRFTSSSDSPNGRQIEVQHMMRLVEENHFVYGINWHGGQLCFNLPWGNIRNTPEYRYWDDAMFHPIGREYTKLNPPMYQNHRDNFDHGLTYGYEWYPVNGGINDWFNHYRRSIHGVVELSHTKWPSSRYLAEYWDNNREAMITYLWRGMRGLHVRVKTDDETVIDVVDVTVDSAPGRYLSFSGPTIHRLTAAGPQHINILVKGYEPKRLELEARIFDGTFTEVELTAY